MESRTPAVPFKAKAACRRHIPKQRHRVTNWAEYDAALRARGSLTVWFTPEAVAAWRAEPRTGILLHGSAGWRRELEHRRADVVTAAALRRVPVTRRSTGFLPHLNNARTGSNH